MAERQRNTPPPLPSSTAASAPRKRVLNTPPPLPTTASTALPLPLLAPMPRPDVVPPTPEPTPPPAVVEGTSYERQPQDAYEMSNANVRDWQGQIASGVFDATITSIPATIGALQGMIANWTRDPATYPEDVPREPGFDNALARFAYNTEFNADDEQRSTDWARKGLYDLSTKLGELAVNTPLSPVSMVARGQQMLTGEGGGWQTFERDPQADYGEPGYVAPAKEILPDIATAAVPLPGTKMKLLGYGADMLTDAPMMLDKGLKMADNLLEWFVPFAMPGTKANMAINAGVAGAMDEGLRDLSGAETMTAPLVDPVQRMIDGVRSSGISGYENAADIGGVIE